jgi:eukaryotic-like serine/threonine-protein kinase
MTTSDFGPGYVIADRYQLVSCLGRGGMGSVWRADHLTLKSPVAVKLIDEVIAASPDALARFMREAQAAAALRSPHVVQTFDYGVHDQVPYIAMELLEGESLAARLDRVRSIPLDETARIITQVARAVSRAHEAGIVHRDLKPDNIFLVHNDDEEIAKVLDFGIAKSIGGQFGNSSQTRTGALLGTPYYMSPEQAEGNKHVEFRTDLWALAIIAFECVVGRRPFESDALGDLVLQICVRPIPVPSHFAQVPPAFDDWFRKGAARKPAERFASARELADELRAVAGERRSRLGSEPNLPVVPTSPGRHSGAAPEIPAPPPLAATTGQGGALARTNVAPHSSRRNVLIAGATAGALLLAGTGAYVLFASGGDQDASELPPPAQGAQALDEGLATPPEPGPAPEPTSKVGEAALDPEEVAPMAQELPPSAAPPAPAPAASASTSTSASPSPTSAKPVPARPAVTATSIKKAPAPAPAAPTSPAPKPAVSPLPAPKPVVSPLPAPKPVVSPLPAPKPLPAEKTTIDLGI